MGQETAGVAPHEITRPDNSRFVADQEELISTFSQDDPDPEWEYPWPGDFTCG